MTDPDSQLAVADECYRCGYDLRGIENDCPCPECGLLAERSRRVSDELHNTRPKWLRRLSLGTWLVLGAIVLTLIAPYAATLLIIRFRRQLLQGPSFINWFLLDAGYMLGWDLAAIVLFSGILFLTTCEGYPAADESDRRQRWALRIFALIPLLGLIALQSVMCLQYQQRYWGWGRPYRDYSLALVFIPVVTLLLCVPLPLLLMLQFRNLAKRARSAHLAEHCAIVGIGTSAALVYLGALMVINTYGDDWFGVYWSNRSNVWLILMLVAGVVAVLFALWSLYLLLRFAISFHRASRQLRRAWRRDDRAAASAVT